MARGKKTGGRNFKKGNRGKPKGAADRVPRSSVKAIFAEISEKQPEMLARAIERGLKIRPPFSFRYLELGAHYLDGKPTQTVELGPETQRAAATLAELMKRSAVKR